MTCKDVMLVAYFGDNFKTAMAVLMFSYAIDMITDLRY